MVQYLKATNGQKVKVSHPLIPSPCHRISLYMGTNVTNLLGIILGFSMHTHLFFSFQKGWRNILCILFCNYASYSALCFLPLTMYQQQLYIITHTVASIFLIAVNKVFYMATLNLSDSLLMDYLHYFHPVPIIKNAALGILVYMTFPTHEQVYIQNEFPKVEPLYCCCPVHLLCQFNFCDKV